MAEMKKIPHIKIDAKEYSQMKTDCDALKKHMEEADSDIAYQGYKRAWTTLSQYYDKATQEIRSAEKAEARKQSREKRQARAKQAPKAS